MKFGEFEDVDTATVLIMIVVTFYTILKIQISWAEHSTIVEIYTIFEN